MLRDFSKSTGGRGGAFENVGLENTWLTPYIWYNTKRQPLNDGWKLHDPPGIKYDIFGWMVQENHISFPMKNLRTGYVLEFISS